MPNGPVLLKRRNRRVYVQKCIALAGDDIRSFRYFYRRASQKSVSKNTCSRSWHLHVKAKAKCVYIYSGNSTILVHVLDNRRWGAWHLHVCIHVRGNNNPAKNRRRRNLMNIFSFYHSLDRIIRIIKLISPTYVKKGSDEREDAKRNLNCSRQFCVHIAR